MTTGKNQRRTFVGKITPLLFNMLSRMIIAFLPRSKCLLISWLQSPSAVILEPPKIKSVTVSVVSPSICHEVMGLVAMIFVFWCWVVNQIFHSPFSLSSRGSLVLLHFLPLGWCHVHIWGYWYSPGNLNFSFVSSSRAFHMMYSASRCDAGNTWCVHMSGNI